MQIAFCHHYRLSFGGGGERLLAEAANFLTSKGHCVEFHCLPFRGGNNFPHLDPSISYHESFLHRVKADVAYYVYAPLVTGLFRTSAPKVLAFHALPKSSFNAPVGNPIESYRRYGPYVTAASLLSLVHSERDFNAFQAIHWVSRAAPFLRHSRVFCIPNWVNTRLFAGCRANDDEFVALFIGRQTYSKGFDRFASAAASCTVEGIRFASTGKGMGKIRGVGVVPYEKMRDLYSTASVVISPARDDSFGLTIVEALASGVPVITSSISSHRALNLPLSYADTSEQISRSVSHLFALWQNNDGGYDQLCQEGRSRANAYDSTKLLPDFESMMREVANNSH